MNNRLIRLTESDIHRMIKEAISNIMFNDILKDENGKPIVFYHSYSNEDSSDMVWLSTSREFSEEFGDNTNAYYVRAKKPLVLNDGILRYEDGTEVMFEGEPASIGYLDAVDDEYIDWIESNYDAVMDDDGYFLVVFNKDQLVPILS